MSEKTIDKLKHEYLTNNLLQRGIIDLMMLKTKDQTLDEVLKINSNWIPLHAKKDCACCANMYCLKEKIKKIQSQEIPGLAGADTSMNRLNSPIRQTSEASEDCKPDTNIQNIHTRGVHSTGDPLGQTNEVTAQEVYKAEMEAQEICKPETLRPRELKEPRPDIFCCKSGKIWVDKIRNQTLDEVEQKLCFCFITDNHGSATCSVHKKIAEMRGKK